MNGIDDDGNGYIDDIHGWNFCAKKNGSPLFEVDSRLNHGTHVSGIITSIKKDGLVNKGIVENIAIMPIIAVPIKGDEKEENVAKAIVYAVENGANVINLSFVKSVSKEKYLVDSAIKYAEKRNVLIVHAAGNSGENCDSVIHFPNAIFLDGSKASNFVDVGWSRPDYTKDLVAYSSNYGPLNVDLFAPGTDVFSIFPNQSFGIKSGTSMAAALTTLVAALLMSNFPSFSAVQIREILIHSCTKPSFLVTKPGTTSTLVKFDNLAKSGGILNAYHAVQLAMEMEKSK